MNGLRELPFVQSPNPPSHSGSDMQALLQSAVLAIQEVFPLSATEVHPEVHTRDTPNAGDLLVTTHIQTIRTEQLGYNGHSFQRRAYRICIYPPNRKVSCPLACSLWHSPQASHDGFILHDAGVKLNSHADMDGWLSYLYAEILTTPGFVEAPAVTDTGLRCPNLARICWARGWDANLYLRQIEDAVRIVSPSKILIDGQLRNFSQPGPLSIGILSDRTEPVTGFVRLDRYVQMERLAVELLAAHNLPASDTEGDILAIPMRQQPDGR